MANDTSGNIKVDFVWGNLPMQPDDERTGDGNVTVKVANNAAQNKQWSGYSVKASPALTKTAIDVTLSGGLTSSVGNNHSVALNNWNGFPDYTPVAPYLDTTDQAAIPNVVGLTEAAATTALTNASFVKGAVTTTTSGAVFTVTKAEIPSTDTVKITTSAPHEVVAGNSITLDISTSGWDGLNSTFTVSSVTSTTITFTRSGSEVTAEATVSGSGVNNTRVGLVKTQTPAAGTVANLGTSVALVKYA